MAASLDRVICALVMEMFVCEQQSILLPNLNSVKLFASTCDSATRSQTGSANGDVISPRRVPSAIGINSLVGSVGSWIVEGHSPLPTHIRNAGVFIAHTALLACLCLC